MLALFPLYLEAIVGACREGLSMGFWIRRETSSPGLRVALCLLALSGCTANPPLERNGIDLRVGSDWKPVSLETWQAPGTQLAAWSGPFGSSLVAYVALAAPGIKAEDLGIGLTTRLENLPELRVLTSDVEKVSGLDAARVVVVAPGTGASLAPTGTGKPILNDGESPVPTRRVSILIPRQTDTVGLLWHAPETSAKWLDGVVGSTLKSIKITSEKLSTSSY